MRFKIEVTDDNRFETIDSEELSDIRIVGLRPEDF